MLQNFTIYSSLLKVDDIDKLLRGTKNGEKVESKVQSFYDKSYRFRKDNPVPSSSINLKGSGLMSLDCWFNEKIVRSICTNFNKSKVLTELTICGMNLSKESCEALNSGLLSTGYIRKLRLNFCLPKRKYLLALMPALCSPDTVPITELSLAANGLTDQNCGDLIYKILIHH